MAQNYHAINGSPYAGSLATGNNPASIVHVPFAWDVTPLAGQFKQTTNAVTIEKFSFLSSPGNAEVSADQGTKKRFVYANQDIRLLNARISLNSKSAIAFGANVRNYVFANSTETNWQDTLYHLDDYMQANVGNLPISGQFAGNAWAELYGSFAHTIIDNGEKILNAGLTVKINRGLAGGYGRADGLTHALSPNGQNYLLTGGSVSYGYSSNFDNLDSNKTASANRKIFYQKTYSSLSADIGLEYILLSAEDEEGSDYAYETKIGLSMMDIGKNNYRYGRRSRLAIAGKTGITDSIMESKFLNVTNIDNFNDSLATIVGSISGIGGAFHIYQPARVMINIDQHIVDNFFVNAELTIPILPVVAKYALFVKDINLLAITPRWETKSLGAYFPILVNNKQQVWVGGAFKAGPLLLGTHNLANIFSKNKTQRGGLYLALTIRPGKQLTREDRNPKNKLPGNRRRSLECPKF
ncbi:MAG: hypothetical protein ABIN01_10545 [Ferruginibacter sp.]